MLGKSTNPNKLHPFFCFYGGKWRVAKHYPSPRYPDIIEPFAGGAGYSCRYPYMNITLCDVDPTVCGLWEYLVKVKPSEIRSLPIEVAHVDELNVCQEAKWLIGFWLNKAATRPMLSPSGWMRSGERLSSHWGTSIRERIAIQVRCIRHWVIKNVSYDKLDNPKAAWFVDPPYQNKCGRYYRYNKIDFSSLSEWCKDRYGQVVVCEQDGADWLPFEPFRTINVTKGARVKTYSKEVIWTKHD